MLPLLRIKKGREIYLSSKGKRQAKLWKDIDKIESGKDKRIDSFCPRNIKVAQIKLYCKGNRKLAVST